MGGASFRSQPVPCAEVTTQTSFSTNATCRSQTRVFQRPRVSLLSRDSSLPKAVLGPKGDRASHWEDTWALGQHA